MRSLLAGASGLLIFVLAGGLLYASAGFKTERIFISGNASPFFVSKPDMRFGNRFEIDFGYQTTFEISSTANQPVQFQIDGSPGGEPCRIRFTDPGTKVCQSKVITIQPNAPATKLFATADNLWPYEYYFDMFGGPLYPSAVMVGTVGGVLVPVDPELELERDYSLTAVITIVAGLVGLTLAWRWWRASRR